MTRRSPDAAARYWRRNLSFTAVLLAIWCGMTFVVAYFARDLRFGFFGWPNSFWVAAQGALVVYVFPVWVYARLVDRLDRQYGVAEEE